MRTDLGLYTLTENYYNYFLLGVMAYVKTGMFASVIINFKCQFDCIKEYLEN